MERGVTGFTAPSGSAGGEDGVHGEEAGEGLFFGKVGRESVGFGDSAVVVAVGAAQLRRHDGVVVEVGEGTVGVEGAGI